MLRLVRRFHEAFGLPKPPRPTRGSDDLVRLRLKLIDEEHEEVREALLALLRAKDHARVVPALQALLKELADLQYVVQGAAVSFGLDLEGAFAEVHRSNMSKLDEYGRPIYRDDGKVLKGPNYSDADMRPFVPDLIEGEAA